MKIAIIEDDSNIVNKLSDLLRNEKWSVDFFNGSTDFGHTSLNYDVIVSDLSLVPIDGRQLLNTLATKTNAELFLMHDGGFDSTDVHNNSLNGLIDKTDPFNVLDKLHYVDVKLRIQKLAEEESKHLENILNNNVEEFSIEEQNSTAIILIKKLDKQLHDKIRQYVERTDKDLIICFSDRDFLTSDLLGTIASYYNIQKKKKKRVAYWNDKKSVIISNIFEACRLDQIVPIFNDLEEAKKHLKS